MEIKKHGITVTVLGSGTCVPSLQRSSCAVLMQIGTTRLLFDSGPGTMRRLLEAKTTIFDLDYILYSHFHPDHSAELVPLIFAKKYPDGNRRQVPLTVIAGRGLTDFFAGLKAVYGNWIELADGLLKFMELDNQSKDFRNYDNFAIDIDAPISYSAAHKRVIF